jgi:hypothetical protein
MSLHRNEPSIDAEGHDAQEHPQNPLADQLAAIAIEMEAVAIHDHVLIAPAFLPAKSKREHDAEGHGGHDRPEDRPANELDEFAIESALAAWDRQVLKKLGEERDSLECSEAGPQGGLQGIWSDNRGCRFFFFLHFQDRSIMRAAIVLLRITVVAFRTDFHRWPFLRKRRRATL